MKLIVRVVAAAALVLFGAVPSVAQTAEEAAPAVEVASNQDGNIWG
ncbi:hypothetical protein ACWGI8_00975 [Streptomyces sp. NPDC054841]